MNIVPPISVYVHLPWCVLKCPYCDFNSHEKTHLPEREYIAALERDLHQVLERDHRHAQSATTAWPHMHQRPIQTIFFGGGTPSLLSADGIDAIIDLLRRTLNFSHDIEITLEANPGTAEADKFNGFYQAGVNRLSLGIQSFDPSKLKALGRIHDEQEAIRAVELAHQAGFGTAKGINLDLMFGLPQQTIQAAQHDIKTAIELNPTHISHYQLTLEPGTAFFYRPPALPKDDDIWHMQLDCQQMLRAHGYEHYEVSAYAQTGKRCRHNINYWQYGDYIGIGAGAHSKLSYTNEIHRISKVKSPEKYIRCAGYNDGIDQAFIVPADERAFEFMMNALRLTNGIDLRLFDERSRLVRTAIEPALQALIKDELFTLTNNTLVPTALGIRFLNVAIEKFL